MKPLSPHWADIAAMKIISTRGDKDKYVVASGITHSGKIHVGNFREAITVDLVGRSLASLGKQVRVIHSWDDFDVFRKVPVNVPDMQETEKYLRKPISRIPDPWGNESTYAQGRLRVFEEELAKVGIHPEFLYQEKHYGSGMYAKEIRYLLENKEKIINILNEYKTTPLPSDWLPTAIYCESCDRDEMEYERYDGEWDYSYKCKSCGHEATTKINETKNLKLAWRVDWPMRWHFEKVDFEPGGKDHSSQGGSFDTGKKIIKELYNEEAPTYLQYDFVMIKGGTGKMSSSSGELFTLDQVLEVYDPQIVRWIFASQKPNRDFALAFDEDVIKIYDEFDRHEAFSVAPCPEKPGKWPLMRRVYELSMLDGKVPEAQPFRPGFRVLCNRLQVCDGDIDRTLDRFYRNDVITEADKESFGSRAKRAMNWLEHHAPEEFRYSIHKTPVDISLSDSQANCLTKLKELLGNYSLETIDAKELNNLIYEKAIHGAECDPKDGFKAIYQKLIGRDQGPRLPSFLKEIGKERLLELL